MRHSVSTGKLSRIARRRGFVGVLASLIIAIALLWAWVKRPPAKPTASLSVISYDTWERNSYSVRVGITNTSGTTLRFYLVSFGQDAVLRVESSKGWATRDIGRMAKLPFTRTSMGVLLPPGSGTTTIIQLPSDTLRWQLTYPVQAAGKRDRMIAKIPAKWRNSLRPLCKRLFSNRDEPEHNVTSDVFDLPLVLKPTNDEPPLRILELDPGAA
jgi:hypothetical protein